MWTTLKTKKDVEDFENPIFELLDQEVKIYFLPIGHKCDEEKLQQINSELIPNMKIIYIHRRVEHEVFCLLQAFKQYKAGFDFEAHFKEQAAKSEVGHSCNCWFCDPDSQDSKDNLCTVLEHMRCPCCFIQTTF